MHRVIALPLALLACLIVAATVLAGGWATIEGSGPSGGQAAGTTTTVELEVLQHGTAAVSWPRITINAVNAATGETVTAAATPIDGQTGHYSAALTFPTEGSWVLNYESPDLVMEGKMTLAVSAPVVPAASTATTAAADPSVVLGIGAAILASLAMLAALIVYERRSDRRKQPTAVGG